MTHRRRHERGEEPSLWSMFLRVPRSVLVVAAGYTLGASCVAMVVPQRAGSSTKLSRPFSSFSGPH